MGKSVEKEAHVETLPSIQMWNVSTTVQQVLLTMRSPILQL